MRYQIGDIIRIFWYDKDSVVTKDNALAVVLTQDEDKNGYIQVEYLTPRYGILHANLRQSEPPTDRLGRTIVEIVSR